MLYVLWQYLVNGHICTEVISPDIILFQSLFPTLFFYECLVKKEGGKKTKKQKQRSEKIDGSKSQQQNRVNGLENLHKIYIQKKDHTQC